MVQFSSTDCRNVDNEYSPALDFGGMRIDGVGLGADDDGDGDGDGELWHHMYFMQYVVLSRSTSSL